MNLKIPKSIKDLRLYHIEAIADVDVDNYHVYDKAVLVHKLTSLDLETVMRISIQQINQIIDHYTKLIGDTKRVDPPKKLEVEGRKFKRIEKVSKMPMSWHIDLQNFGASDAAVVAAFVYIEEDFEYCAKDEHGNVLNPVAMRAEHFREYLSADISLDIGFFLEKKSESYAIAYEEIKNQRRIRSEKKEKKDKRRKG